MAGLLTGGYVHCDRLVAIGPGHEAPDLLKYLQEAASEILTGLVSGDAREKVWRVIESKATAHFLAAYRSFIE